MSTFFAAATAGTRSMVNQPGRRSLSAQRGAVRTRPATRHLGWWTVGIWLACLPIAIVVPGIIGLSPLTLRGSAPPLLVGVLLLSLGILAALRWRGEVVPCVVAAAFAGWIVLTMHTALYGTPYGFGGILGDLGRVTAMANRYSHTLHSSDGIVHGIPSDYPPLFPWLIGRASALSGIAAWRLMGVSEAILTSAAIVFPFLLWRRLLPAGVALVVTLVCFTLFVAPSKPYEVLAIGLVVPWVLTSFADPPRGRLHWLGAGILGGLQVVLYQGYVMFAAPAIIALVIVGLRGQRPAVYARHVAGVVIAAAVVSSWYVVPYLHWSVTHRLQMTDRFQNSAIGGDPFPFLALTPVGLLTAIGAIGLIYYRRKAWWAAPIALIVLGDYVYRFISEIGFIADGQTGVFQYTSSALAATLGIAAALTLWHALPGILRRLSLAGPTLGLRVSVVAALAAAIGIGMWHAWMPGAPPTPYGQYSLTSRGNEATQAFQQPLPDGRYVSFAPAGGRLSWFPVSQIVSDVDQVRGTHSAPPTLSVSEELFDFRSWPGYLGVSANAAAATSEWYSRLAALEALSHVHSPAAFAAASAHTAFGPIDVFILARGTRTWNWTPGAYDAQVRFAPADFSMANFRIFRGLPGGLVVAVRRPTTPRISLGAVASWSDVM